jgi:membrane protease YdiL (CAAX protease family)
VRLQSRTQLDYWFLLPFDDMNPVEATVAESTIPEPDVKREAPWALVYFALYFSYLFLTLENEFLHWFSLVTLPFAVILLSQRWKSGLWSVRAALSSIGLKRGNLKTGLWWAIAVGLALSGLQLVLSRNSAEILNLFSSGKAFYLFPLSIALMLFTAGTTEEFFFRGVLQTRLQLLLRSDILAIAVTSVLFGLYHLPYAYLNPHWPSHGNWPEAFGAAFGQGVPMGLILGFMYTRTKNNLVACTLVHALINSFPAMLIIKIG